MTSKRMWLSMSWQRKDSSQYLSCQQEQQQGINLDANFAQSMKINLAKFFLYCMTTGEDFMVAIHVVSIYSN